MPPHFTWSGGDAPHPDAVAETATGHVAWHRTRADGRSAAGHADPLNGQTYEVVSLWGARSAARTAANQRAGEGPMYGLSSALDGGSAWAGQPRYDGSWVRWGVHSAASIPLGLLGAGARIVGGFLGFAARNKPF